MRLLKKLRHRKQLDQDLQDELAFHLAMDAKENGSGARQRFGNPTSFKEACREMWTFTTLETWWQDIRYAARTIRNNVGFTAVAVLALALGIGANTTVFTIVSAALALDLGVDNIERMVMVTPSDGYTGSYLDFRELQPQVKTIQNLAAYRMAMVNVSDHLGALPDSFALATMTINGFSELRGKMQLGRSFLPADQAPAAAPVVMLSHRVWQNRYGKDPSIIGKTIRVDDAPRVIVGVRPPGMNFPEDVDMWVPLIPTAGNTRNLVIFGPLAPGFKLAAARAELNELARRAAPEQTVNPQKPLAGVQLYLMMYGVYAARPMFYAMLGAVGFVLLIVCADVANLLLARAAVRSREISIRIAIGAGRVRIIRQLLIESVMLAAIGGFFGWLVARAGLHAFDSSTSKFPRPAWVDFSMNPRVFIYLAAISVGAGILFGLAPALRLSKVDVNNSIKDGGHGASGGRLGSRLSNLLVAFEMALCVVLLAGAGLLIRSSIKLYNSPLGVNPSNVLTMRINLPEAKYPKPTDELQFHSQLKDRLTALPGVESAALASNLPYGGYLNIPFRVEAVEQSDVEQSADSSSTSGEIAVSDDYFRVMQVEPIAGRLFQRGLFQGDDRDSAIVNKSFAERFWPGASPLGKRVRVGSTPTAPWLTVTGVIPDIPQNFQRPLEHQALIYLPYSAAPLRQVFIVAKTAIPPYGLGNAFRKAVQGIDENLPAFEVRTLEDRIAQNRLNVGSMGVLFTIFAAIALVLAFVGLYAVMAHSVSQRTQEIGLRMALGGSPGDIRRLLFAQGLRPLVWGLIFGLPLAFGVTRVLRGSLVGISPGDPVTFAGVVIVLLAAGVLGCVVPARRATRVDPVIALRCE